MARRISLKIGWKPTPSKPLGLLSPLFHKQKSGLSPFGDRIVTGSHLKDSKELHTQGASWEWVKPQHPSAHLMGWPRAIPTPTMSHLRVQSPGNFHAQLCQSTIDLRVLHLGPCHHQISHQPQEPAISPSDPRGAFRLWEWSTGGKQKKQRKAKRKKERKKQKW